VVEGVIDKRCQQKMSKDARCATPLSFIKVFSLIDMSDVIHLYSFNKMLLY